MNQHARALALQALHMNLDMSVGINLGMESRDESPHDLSGGAHRLSA